MPSYEHNSEEYLSGSHLLSPTLSPRKSPARQPITSRRSSSSLRSSAHQPLGINDDATNGRHSLAHELAVALMPEPSSGSRLLAEEFGIEFDEGAEGIDNDADDNNGLSIIVDEPHPVPDAVDGIFDKSSFDEVSFGVDPSAQSESCDERNHTLSSSRCEIRQTEDPMEALAQSLESTDRFISHLRRLDSDSSGPSQQVALETFAADVIRRINDTARDREGQLRELLEYEREFRRIGGEVGGTEVLSRLAEFDEQHDAQPDSRQVVHTRPPLTSVDGMNTRRNILTDSYLNLEQPNLGDTVYPSEMDSPVRDSFSLSTTVIGSSTTATILPQFTELRTFTASLVSSLTVVSEQAQVNGAATTEAGRKIRALRNKLTGWQTDLDSADASRIKIEKWEAGLTNSPNSSPGTLSPRRVDGREIVAEHLHLFERLLAEAAHKTQAIMAA